MSYGWHGDEPELASAAAERRAEYRDHLEDEGHDALADKYFSHQAVDEGKQCPQCGTGATIRPAQDMFDNPGWECACGAFWWRDEA